MEMLCIVFYRKIQDFIFSNLLIFVFSFELALLVFVLLYLAIGYGGQLLSNILGFIYPSYASMKAIESKDKGDDTKWLTYWVVFGFVNIAELPLEFILSYIPFFYLFKVRRFYIY